MNNKHWNFGVVLAAVEHLFGFEQRRIETFHFNFTKYLQEEKKVEY